MKGFNYASYLFLKNVSLLVIMAGINLRKSFNLNCNCDNNNKKK